MQNVCLWPWCGEAIVWGDTWTMLAGLGAFVAAIATVFYAGYVVATLREMQRQRLDGAQPLVVFRTDGVAYDTDELQLKIVFSNLNAQAPALGTSVFLQLKGGVCRGIQPPANLAFPAELQDAYRVWTRGQHVESLRGAEVVALYSDTYGRRFESRAPLLVRVGSSLDLQAGSSAVTRVKSIGSTG